MQQPTVKDPPAPGDRPALIRLLAEMVLDDLAASEDQGVQSTEQPTKKAA